MPVRRTALSLAPGARVGVVAPGFAVPRAALRAGVQKLRAMGFEVVLGRHVLARDGYLAGDDRRRGADLAAMIRDPAVRGIWFARGGYGTARLLDSIPWSEFARRPKTLVGYSDVTAFFAAVLARTRRVCLYGPVVCELGASKSYHATSLRRLLSGEEVAMPISRRGVLRHGRAEGRLVGGNLSVLVHLLGTPHFPVLEGAILFVEDTGEPVYRIDRMLQHLKMAGALEGIGAVLVGGLDTVSRTGFPPDRRLREVLEEFLLPLRVPVVTGLRAGHVRGKWTLPLGGTARLDTRAGRIALDPAGARAGTRR